MTDLTLADYEAAIEQFADQLGELENDLVALFLFGSMARGEAVAGYSDLDFWIFLATAVFHDETRFKNALKTIIAAHDRLPAQGIPVSNAGCYASQANIERLPALLLPNLQSETASRVVVGENIREQMQTTTDSRRYNGASTFFEMRRFFYHPLAKYLNQPLDEIARWSIFAGLQYIKYLPEAVCAALDLWPGEHGALAVLAERWPDEDWEIIARVKTFCAQQGVTAVESQMLAHLQETLQFIERLNDRIVAHLQTDAD